MDLVDHSVGVVGMLLDEFVGMFPVSRVTRHVLGHCQIREHAQGPQAAFRRPGRIVIECIRAHVFWPPAETIDYDDFERLFHGGVQESIEAKTFASPRADA